MPRVSVITPTFNCAPFIERALASVFAQTYVDYEVIVLDDGSTDGTEQVVAQWRGKVSYIRQANRGLSAARNAAVAMASGEFLAYLDADDMWYPTKLERQIAFLDSHPECGIVHSELTVIDECDEVLFREWYRGSDSRPARGLCVHELLEGLPIQVPTVVERRTAFERTGGFDDRLRRCEDYLHWFELVLHGYEIGYVDAPLAMYRRRARSLSRGQAAMAEGLLQVFRILLDEHRLWDRLDADGQKAVTRRVAALERRLLKCYRWEGRHDVARRKAARLIGESPFELEPYLEFLKSCVPVSVAHGLRELKR